jgi:TM2 domain-containing membrane protein YozV
MQITDATVMMAFQVRKKETLVAFLLWWFLGTVGGHRFYCNRSGSGAAMLVTTLLSIPLCYVFCIGFIGLFAILIWWIIDAFFISGWVQQHNQEVMNQIEYARHQHNQAERALPLHAPPSTPVQAATATGVTLRVRTGNLEQLVSCETGRPVSFGSAAFCRVVIEEEGIAPVHGEWELLPNRSFLVRTLNGTTLNLASGQSDGPLSEFLVLGPGTVDQAETGAPFVMEVGTIRAEVRIA